jgi:hypothetical protein
VRQRQGAARYTGASERGLRARGTKVSFTTHLPCSAGDAGSRYVRPQYDRSDTTFESEFALAGSSECANRIGLGDVVRVHRADDEVFVGSDESRW